MTQLKEMLIPATTHMDTHTFTCPPSGTTNALQLVLHSELFTIHRIASVQDVCLELQCCLYDIDYLYGFRTLYMTKSPVFAFAITQHSTIGVS